MLLRHANLIRSLILIWDVVCLQLCWSVTRLYLPNVAKAASLFDGWHVATLGALWLASDWLFRIHNHQDWHRLRDGVRHLIAAVSFFVGLSAGVWSLSSDPPTLSSFPLFWSVTLAAVGVARVTGAAVRECVRAARLQFNKPEAAALALGLPLMIVGVVVRNLFDAMFIGSLASLFWILVATGLSRMPSRGES